VAPEIISKGHCSTKKQYRYGLKLHALASAGKENYLSPKAWSLSLRRNEAINNRTILGDKIYSDFKYFNDQKSQN